MEQLIRVARTLRRDHGFAGYIHLKTIPEASPWLIEQAGLWADRLSINLELPDRGQPRAPRAREDARRRSRAAMGQMRERIAEAQGREAPLLPRRPEHPGDRRRRRHHRRRRARPPARGSTTATSCAASTTPPSARSPSRAPSLPLKPPPLQRENRLYQADWLLRFYGFTRRRDRRRRRGRHARPRRRPEARLGAASTATASRSTSTAPRASCCCACPASAPRPSTASSRARRHTRAAPRRPRPPDRQPSPRRCPSSSPPTTAPPASTGSTCARRLRAPARAAEPLRMIADRARPRRRPRRLPRAPSAGSSPPASPPEDGRLDRPTARRRSSPTRRCDEAPAGRRCPAPLADLIRLVVCHRDPERYALLYAAGLAAAPRRARSCSRSPTDPLVHRLERMAKSVRRDLHKMHAFVRFRRVEADGGERFVAWFEPDHFILEATADFFVDRFRALRLDDPHPDRLAALGPRDAAPSARRRAARTRRRRDPFEAGWRGYYESTFNPARLNLAAMRGHMPKKYWQNLPETAAIPELVRTAPARVREMIDREAAMPAQPRPRQGRRRHGRPGAAHARRRSTASSPRAEPMVAGGTRAVLGEGPGRRRHRLRRRAARRPGGPAGPPLRRPRRPAVRPRAGRGRHRPRARSTSPTRSSISSSSSAASAACTSARPPARSSTTAGG